MVVVTQISSLLFCTVGALLLSPFAKADGIVRLASDDWCPFVCVKDAKVAGGYLVDATALAMASAGYRVKPVLMPLNRAIGETDAGNIEGVYAPPADPRLRLSAPIAHSYACFYTRVGQTWTYLDLHSLAGVRIGAIDNYGYDDGVMDAYIVAHRADHKALDFSYGATAGTTNLHKLLAGRFPVMLEHEAVVEYLARMTRSEGQLRQAGCLKQALPLTIGFSSGNKRAPLWLQTLDEGLKKLEASGALKILREQYAIPSGHARQP